MKLKLILLCFFFACLHRAYAQQYDTSYVTVLRYDTANVYMKEQFTAKYRNAPLSDTELHEGEAILRNLVADYNAKLKGTDKYDAIDLNKYKRQYIALLTPANQKILWINGFCSAPADWKTNIVYVFGGGSCFFQSRMIMGEKKTAVFYINGRK